MFKNILTLAAMIAAMTLGSTAQAVTLTATPGDAIVANSAGDGFRTILDFNAEALGALGSGDGIVVNSTSSQHAVPANLIGNYFSVPKDGLTSGAATLDLTGWNGAKDRVLSFYWGSIDTYNTVNFLRADGTVIGSFSGQDITANANGDQVGNLTNQRVNFRFTAAEAAGLAKIGYASAAIAFESGSIAASVGTVPEPQVWAMLVIGFGLVGVSARGRQKTIAA